MDFDWANFGVTLVQAIIPVLTTLAVAGARYAVAKIPRAFLPLFAVAIATGLDFLVAFISGGAFNPVVGALLGGAAVWLREFINTLQEHGLES